MLSTGLLRFLPHNQHPQDFQAATNAPSFRDIVLRFLHGCALQGYDKWDLGFLLRRVENSTSYSLTGLNRYEFDFITLSAEQADHPLGTDSRGSLADSWATFLVSYALVQDHPDQLA